MYIVVNGYLDISLSFFAVTEYTWIVCVQRFNQQANYIYGCIREGQ